MLFVHGNVSSALFWQTTLLALPAGFRGLAVDLRGFGDTDPLPVDATRGVGDFDDVAALAASLELGRIHLVGWSLGGGVAMQFRIDHPDQVASLALVDPVSPYGLGGTRGVDGQLLSPDGAGSGAGFLDPEFVARLAAGDISEESASSPRRVLRAVYVKPPFVPEHENIYVAAMLSTRVGPDNFPGDSVTSDAWPHVAPGKRGPVNAIAPTHLRLDGIVAVHPKPPIG